MAGADQVADSEIGKRSLIRWPDEILGPPPGLKGINVLCWAQFIGLILIFSYLFGMQIRNQSGLFHHWRCDFINFYGIGEIVNEYPAARLYDYTLQTKMFDEINPAPAGTYGPSPYPPFVALFFSLFARFPFNSAYVLWAVVSLTLYISGIAATLRAVFPGEGAKNSLIFCLALEFSPFIVFTFANGQLSAIAIASVGFALLQEKNGKPFRSGLALSLLTYKPTLLLLLIPMLLITRRFKTLFGFITGAAGLMAIATIFDGIQIWPVYAGFLGMFGKVAGLNGHSALNLSIYVDWSSFSHLVPGGRSRIGLAILFCSTAATATWLAFLLWRSARSARPVQYLAWAATLTWTLLLNVYVPIYDSTLVVIAIILTLAALMDLKRTVATGWIVFLSVLIFAVSWVTVAIAVSHQIQLLTVVVAVLGWCQLGFLRRETLKSSSKRPIDLCAE